MKQWLRSLLFGCLILGPTAAQAADAIATQALNMRSGPGTRYAVRAAIPAGHPIDVRACSRNWCQVHYRGHMGWASARYLAFKNGKAGNYMMPSHQKPHHYRQWHDGRRGHHPQAPSHGGWWGDHRQAPPHKSGWWRPSNWWHHK